MNISAMMVDGLRSMAAAPVWVVLLVKITAILSIAWLVHGMLRNANPRWRVLLWRVTAIGLISLPTMTWLFPSLPIPVQPSPVQNVAVVAPPAAHETAPRAAVVRQHAFSAENVSPVEPTLFSPQSPQEPQEAMASGPAMPRPTATTPVTRLSWRTWLLGLVGLWLGGLLVMGVRLMIGQYRLAKVIRAASHPPKWIEEGCRYVAQKIGCASDVEVLQSDDVSSPFLCGLRRPRLLLPARMCNDSYCKDLPGVFAHELAHVQSHDVFWNVGLQLMARALWFHPLVWRMPCVHLASCEMVCDAVSANFIGDVADYCRTLARIAIDAHRVLPAAGLAMARTSAIARRLNALRQKVFHLPLRRRNVIGFGVAAILGVSLVGALQFALASQPDDKAAESALENQTADQSSDPSQTAVEDAQAAVFTLKPRNHLLSIPTADFYIQEIALSDKPPKDLKAEPKYRTHRPYYGELKLGVGPNSRVAVAVDAVQGEKTRIYVDRNHDRNLANDGFIGDSGDVSIDAPYPHGSIPCSVNLSLWCGHPDSLRCRVDTCREGEITLDGRTYRIVVQDDAHLARYDHLDRDLLVIDVNQDGQFEAERLVTHDHSSAELFSPDQPLNIHGKVWKVTSITPDGLSITFRPSTAKVSAKAYLSPGSPAPDFTATDWNGKPFHLMDAAAKAKFVLLHFWVSSGRSSQNALRDLRKLYAQYKDSGLLIVGVNGDHDVDAARRMVKEFALPYPQILDRDAKDGVKRLYRFPGNTYMYLIDSHGKIVDCGGPSIYGRRHYKDLLSALQKTLGPGDKKGAVQTEKDQVAFDKAFDNAFAHDSSIGKAFSNARGFHAIVVPRPAAWDQFDVRAVALRLPYVYVMSRAIVPEDIAGKNQYAKNLLIAKLTQTDDRVWKAEYIKIMSCVSDGVDMIAKDNALWFATSKGVAAYSLADPVQPTLAHIGAVEKFASPTAFVECGKNLFLLQSRRFSVFDVTRPLEPRFLTTVAPAAAGWSGCVVDGRLYLGGGFATADGSHESHMLVYDVAKPGDPKAVGSATIGSGRAYQLMPLDAKRLLVAKTKEMAMYSLNDPLKPTLIGSPISFAPRYSRTAVMFASNGRKFVIVNGKIYSVESKTLAPYGDFTWGGNVDGYPYRAAVQGNCIAIPSSAFVTVLFADAAAMAQQSTVEASTSEGGSMRVRVVDGASQPMVGAKVWANYRGGKVRGTTDSQGNVALTLPQPDGGYIYLFACPDGFTPLRKCWTNQDGRDPRPNEFTFRLESGRTIGGTIRDEQGKPIQGVKVRLNLSDKRYAEEGVAMVLWDRAFSTDADGRWHLDHAPATINSMSIQLGHPDYIAEGFSRQVDAVEKKQIENRTSVMVMKRGLAVAGTVTDPDGKPVANALVAQGDDRIGGAHFPTTRTDQAGRYRLGSFAPGGAVLTVISPGLAPAIRNLNVQPGMPAVDFQLTKGHLLRIRVVDKQGHPIKNVFVVPDTWRGHRTLTGLGIPKRTDAEGRWSWSWAPKGAVEMQIAKGGYLSSGMVRLIPQEAEQVIVLPPALTITGRVVDAATKQPIPKFHAIPGCIVPQWDQKMNWNPQEAVDGKAGRYKTVISRSWTLPAPTAYLVRIEADGYQPAVSREFKSDEGNVRDDFSLTKGNVLRVSVRLPDGKPAAGADVALCPEEPGKFYNMATFVRNGQFASKDMYDSSKTYRKVDANGQLFVQPQDNPFLLIVVHDQGFAKTTSEDLKAKPEITLQAWARLEGIVRHGTKPVPNAMLDTYPIGSDGGMRWGFLNFQDQTKTDADGKFVFPKLKPGRWQVRLLPVDQSGRSSNEKSVELPPGKTVHVMLGGEGRPVVGRVQWPNGKPSAAGDWSKIGADIRPKTPEPAQPPKDVRDQGPDAVRTWMTQWRESAQKQSRCPAIASVDSNGSLHIEGVTPGSYELNVYVQVKGENLPWEHPKLLRYKGEFSVPTFSGGVRDAPLNLGDVPLKDESPRTISYASAKTPPPQAPGQKTVGGLRDNLDLLQYVVQTYQQNKAKIRTWQGKAMVESHSTHSKNMAVGNDYQATVRFVFDRAQKSIRWNETLEKWTRSVQGRQDPQTVPQIFNGMMTPEGLYRLGQNDLPGNPAQRPLVLTIYPPTAPFGRLQPQLYDFNPLYYLDTFRGDVAQDLSAYIGWADHPGVAAIKIIREGDHVMIDIGAENYYNRCTFSLNQGCNPVRCDGTSPGMTSEWRWTYENVDGVWLPKTWSYVVHQKNVRDEERTVTFVKNLVNQPVEPKAFSFPALGVQMNDKVQDRRTQPIRQYQYEGEQDRRTTSSKG